MARLFRFAFRLMGGLFALLAIFVGLLAWKMAEPLSSRDFTPYVAAAIARAVPGTQAEIGSSTVAWDNHKHTLSLSCEQVKLTGPDGAAIADFPSVRLKVGLWSLLRGRVLPIEMKADNARFWLTRRADGVLSPGDKAAPPGQGGGSTDLFAFLQKVGDEISNERLEHEIAINEAVISVHDETIQQDWTLVAREISLTHNQRQAEGRARIALVQGDRSASFEAHYLFDPHQRLHLVNLGFKDIRLSTLASQNDKLAVLAALDLPLSGELSFGTDRELNVSKIDLAVEGGVGAFKAPTLWDRPRDVQKVVLAAHYDATKGKAELSSFVVDFGGPKLVLTGEAAAPPSRDLIWLRPRTDNAFTLTARLENLPMDQFGAVWPKIAVPGAREWMTANLSKGSFTQGEVTLKGRVDWRDLENSSLDSGSGKIAAQGARVTYMPGMPAIDGVSAEGVFDLDHMDVKILGGSTGAIKLQPFTLRMSDFEKDVQSISIPVKLTGPGRDILKLLDSPPLGYAKAIGLNPEDASGQVDGTLSLRMPMLEDLLLKDVEIKAEARFSAFGLRNMIPGIEVSQGDLAFALDQKGFTLKGPVALNKVPVQLAWKSRFDEEAGGKDPLHEATVTGAIKGEGWAALGLAADLAQVKGETPVTVRYANLRKGFSRLSLEANLKSAAVTVEPLGWNKPAGTAAKLAVAMEMPSGKPLQIKTIDLQGVGLKVKGSAEVDAATGEVRELALKPFILGRSNAALRYSKPVDPAQPLRLTVEGESLDIAGMNNGSSGGKKEATGAAAAPQPAPPGRAKSYKVTLGKLYTGENGFMTNLEGVAERDAEGWKEIDLKGLAQGRSPLSVKLAPEEAHEHLSVETKDFGEALLGLGFSETVEGGELWIDGRSDDKTPRSVKGVIKISSFTVTDWPVLARLLNAISPFGFVDLITGEASFDRLRSDFVWRGDELELNKLRAVGSVIGINLDGRVNLDGGALNLSGTVVPFSFVNSIIGSIPLLGDVITGGDGQGVLAASFTVRGTTSEPNVSVNPISLLTPGFLRNLFFSGDENEEKTPAH